MASFIIAQPAHARMRARESRTVKDLAAPLRPRFSGVRL